MSGGGQLGDFLTAINKTKEDIFADQLEAASKAYPAFMVNRLLSYHKDCVLLCNELNLVSAQITNQQHYHFLLHSIPKKNRFAKLEKAEKEWAVELMIEFWDYSRKKAEEALPLLTEAQLEQLKLDTDKGGKRK